MSAATARIAGTFPIQRPSRASDASAGRRMPQRDFPLAAGRTAATRPAPLSARPATAPAHGGARGRASRRLPAPWPSGSSAGPARASSSRSSTPRRPWPRPRCARPSSDATSPPRARPAPTPARDLPVPDPPRPRRGRAPYAIVTETLSAGRARPSPSAQNPVHGISQTRLRNSRERSLRPRIERNTSCDAARPLSARAPGRAACAGRSRCEARRRNADTPPPGTAPPRPRRSSSGRPIPGRWKSWSRPRGCATLGTVFDDFTVTETSPLANFLQDRRGAPTPFPQII